MLAYQMLHRNLITEYTPSHTVGLEFFSVIKEQLMEVERASKNPIVFDEDDKNLQKNS